MQTIDKANRLYGCICMSPNSTEENDQKLLKNIFWAKEKFSEIILIVDSNLPFIDWDIGRACTVYSNMFLDCIQDNSIE